MMKIAVLIFVLLVFTGLQNTALLAQDPGLLSKTGDSLYYLKEYDKSIQKYEESLNLDPLNTNVIYNAACVYSLLNKPDDAFVMLEQLPGLGYENLGWISKDTDLDTLHNDSRWKNLLTAIQQNRDRRKDILNMKIVTSDIDNFWVMYDIYKTSGYSGDIQKFYFDKKSPGLKEFTQRREINAAAMEKVIKAYPKYLESVRANTLKLKGITEKLKGYFRKLKQIYPDVLYPDIYFTIGCFNTGGTVSGRMLLIGSEMMCADEDSPKDELNKWLKGNIGNFDNIEQIVMHESVHTLQSFNPGSLLSAAISEGACDFIAQKVTGKELASAHYNYGNKYEEGLWKEFKKEMNGSDLSRWLYSGERSVGRPSDLGYFIGYKICESYYNNSEDKTQAIKDIIEVTDFDAFLKKSGYEEKFSK